MMTYYQSIARYLRNSRSINIKDSKFSSVYETVKLRCREIEDAGDVVGINKGYPFRKEDIKQAFDKGCFGRRSILGRTSQRLPLRILDLEFVYQNPLRTSRDDPWDH